MAINFYYFIAHKTNDEVECTHMGLSTVRSKIVPSTTLYLLVNLIQRRMHLNKFIECDCTFLPPEEGMDRFLPISHTGVESVDGIEALLNDSLPFTAVGKGYLWRS